MQKSQSSPSSSLPSAVKVSTKKPAPTVTKEEPAYIASAYNARFNHSVLQEHHEENINAAVPIRLMKAANQLIDICAKRPKQPVPTVVTQANTGTHSQQRSNKQPNARHSTYNNSLPTFVITKVIEKTPSKFPGLALPPIKSDSTIGTTQRKVYTQSSPAMVRAPPNIEPNTKTKIKIELSRKEIQESLSQCLSDSIAIIDDSILPGRRLKARSVQVNTKKVHSTIGSVSRLTRLNDVPPKLSPPTKIRVLEKQQRWNGDSNTQTSSNRSQHLIITPMEYAGFSANDKPKKLIASNVARPISVTVRKITVKASHSQRPMGATKSAAPTIDDRIKYKRATTIIEPLLKRQHSADDLSSFANMHSKKLPRRRDSDFAGVKAQRALFDEKMGENNQYSELYSLCSDVVSHSRNPFTVRKKGRPRKAQYSNKTRALLCTPEFSTLVDRRRIYMEYYGSELLPHEWFNANTSTSYSKTSKRNKHFALLSIEPIMEKSPKDTHARKVYGGATKAKQMRPPSPAKEIQTQQQNLDLINVEILQAESLDLSGDLLPDDDVFIEYLDDDNDDIDSPAYEPIVSRSLMRSESLKMDMFQTMCDISQLSSADTLLASEDFDHLHVSTLPSALADLPLLNVDDDFNDRSLFGGVEMQPLLTISPQRKTTRKRKMSNECVHFIKRNATNSR